MQFEIINKTIIGLSQNKEMDRQVLAYAEKINKVIPLGEIDFVYTHQPITIPEDVSEEFPELHSNLSESFIQQMKESVADFSFGSSPLSFHVLEGDVLLELVKKTFDDDTDLVIVGKHKKTTKHHLNQTRLCRKVPCHVLLIPENCHANFKNIFVPTDFSDFSKFALEEAIYIAMLNQGNIILHHLYEVPWGYSSIGKSYEEFAEIMGRNSMKKCRRFLEGVDHKDVSISPLCTLNKERHPYEDILLEALNTKADFIVIGAKGRTNLSALLLGSTAEGLIQTDEEIPVLVIKNKEFQFGFWEAFKKI